MMCIIISSVMLTFYDYKDEDALTLKNQALNTVGNLMTVIFILEATLKIAG